jgi:predicted membrane protein
MEENNKNRNGHRGGLVWPIILILVGTIFLLNNLGIIGNVTWQTVLQFWPILLVAIGLDGLFRRNEIVGPVFMIGLGAILLMSNLGILIWDAWETLWRLWPLLIIAIGLEVMVGRRSLWISLLSVIFIFAVLFGVLWLSDVGIGTLDGQPLAEDEIGQPLGEATRAEIVLAPAVGDLSVEALPSGNQLIAGTLRLGNMQQAWDDYDLDGETVVYTLRSRNVVPVFGDAWDWDLGLISTVPIDLDTSMGAGDMVLDLLDLNLSALDVSQGVGKIELTLPSKGAFDAQVNQAIGSIVLHVPDNVGLRLDVSKAISSLDVPDGFQQRGGYYYAPGYETADERVTLEVSQAIGSIDVRYK